MSKFVILRSPKASFVEFLSCFATVKTTIQERESDVHIKPN